MVGHSWGALVALEMALLGEASGLVLLAGYYRPTLRYDLPCWPRRPSRSWATCSATRCRPWSGQP